MSNPVVYVDLYRTMFLRKREWRWRARNAGNQRLMATSAEGYRNLQDCLDAVEQLFGSGTDVYLRQAEHNDVELRMAR